MTKAEEIDEATFCARFTARLLAANAPIDRFDDGTTFEEYGAEVAPTYYETDWQRALGPEECADADMSYWGE